MNPFLYAYDNKRYHTLAYHNRIQNCKTQKAVLDAGFSCPNLDGTCGTGGCVFCDNGSGYFTADSRLSVTEQFQIECIRIRKKRPDAAVIAYFQAHTNTYAPVEALEKLYREAMAAGAAGLSIATRPDCIGEEVARLLGALSKEIPVTVELGLQTSDDESAVRINRGYLFSAFDSAVKCLKKEGIRICVHVICGLPGETAEQMCRTAQAVAAYRPDAVKIHLLHVIAGTPLAAVYQRGDYVPMTLPGYVDAVIQMLEHLPPETVIERITGDGDREKLLAPLWSLDKLRVLGTIDREMAQRNTWQGRLYSSNDLQICRKVCIMEEQ